jgi:hypothetical protein
VSESTGGPIQGIELRDVLARDYANNARRLGVPNPDMAALTELAKQDLELVDRHDREGVGARGAGGGAQVEETDVRESGEERLAAALAEDNVELETTEEERQFLALDVPVSRERRLKLLRRVVQICAPRGDLRAAMLRGGLIEAAQEMADPELAREVIELNLNYQSFQTRESKWNPFRGLTPQDAARAYIRGLEDIADRSTGRFGPWWVK